MDLSISYSSLSTFKKSPLEYYFYKIAQIQPTVVNSCYGDAGNAVHKALEYYIESSDQTGADSIFTEKINKLPEKGMFGETINTQKFRDSFLEGIRIIEEWKQKGYELQAEEKFELEEIIEGVKVTIKGYVDCIAKKEDKIHILDWKTNSSLPTDGFKGQQEFYTYLYYKKHGVLPYHFHWYMLKTGGKVEHYYDMKTVAKVERELIEFVKYIKERGNNASLYEPGEYNHPFNNFYEACQKEVDRRQSQTILEAVIHRNHIKLKNITDRRLTVALDKLFSYDAEGHQYSDKYMDGTWDGRIHFLKVKKENNTTYHTLPIGFYWMLQDFIEKYNQRFALNYKVVFEDQRNKQVLDILYETKFKTAPFDLRYYQHEAVAKIIEKKIGIINGGTGCLVGDSYIDIPRDLKKYPKGIKIKDLLDKSNFPIYSFNKKTNKLELDNCLSVIYSGMQDVYEIQLENNKSIIATQDHKFLTVTDSYRKHIKKTEYKSLAEFINNYKDVRILSQNRRDNFIRTDFENCDKIIEHSFIMKELYGDEYEKNVCHHKDKNKFNNSIENLLLISEHEHLRLHAMESTWKKGKDAWKHKGEHPRGFLGHTHSEEEKFKIGISSKINQGRPGTICLQERVLKEKHSRIPRKTKGDVIFEKNSIKISKILQEKLKDPEFKKQWLKKSSNNAKISYQPKILNIKYIGKRKTYDLEVEKNNNFFANELCVHNSGKSAITAEALKQINKRGLVIVNRLELVEQTADALEDYLGVRVGRMYEGVLDIKSQFTVASVQTISALLDKSDIKPIVTYLFNVNALFFDECQNVTDKGFYNKILKYLVNASYIIGLSGSAWRNYEPETLSMKALVGDIIYSKTTAELEAEGFICPTKCYFVRPHNEETPLMNNYHDAYDFYITKNEVRNKLVIDIVNKYRDTKKILILTKLIEHGKTLSESISDSILINSHTKTKDRKESYGQFQSERGFVLIGSQQIFATGVNIPDLDMIINVSASKSSIMAIQSIGRVKRKYPGKEYGYYIDFFDNDCEMFSQGSKKRMQLLDNHGNETHIVYSLEDLFKKL